LLAAPQAMAASAASCQHSIKGTVDGTVSKVIHYDTGTWLYIETPSWDCGPITILAKDAGTCILGSTIHATGTLSKPDSHRPYNGWSLTDAAAGNGSAGYHSSFSCQ
jgi:hypothetical protein